MEGIPPGSPRGLFYEPAVIEFEVGPNEDKTIVAKVRPIAPGSRRQWISADQHVHIMRAREDDDLLMRWMQAEDLNVLNNLEGQRQQHFGVQYAWGRSGEARMPGQSIRSGHEDPQRLLRARSRSGREPPDPAAGHW